MNTQARGEFLIAMLTIQNLSNEMRRALYARPALLGYNFE